MLDLSKEERDLLNRVGKKGKVHRQAEVFVLHKGTRPNFIVDAGVCLSLIKKGALKEVQENDKGWIYVAEVMLFAPNYVVGHGE